MSDTILAVDLGRHKSVGCIYGRRTREHTFRTLATISAGFGDILARHLPHVVERRDHGRPPGTERPHLRAVLRTDRRTAADAAVATTPSSEYVRRPTRTGTGTPRPSWLPDSKSAFGLFDGARDVAPGRFARQRLDLTGHSDAAAGRHSAKNTAGT